MGERRILVIGSQCERLQRLSFLPGLAEELYAVLTDPERGSCVPAIGDHGLLLDPSVEEAHNALEAAFERASKDEATLLLAFIGHGQFAEGDEDFYFLPRDASHPPTSRKALHLVQVIRECLQLGRRPLMA